MKVLHRVLSGLAVGATETEHATGKVSIDVCHGLNDLAIFEAEGVTLARDEIDRVCHIVEI